MNRKDDMWPNSIAQRHPTCTLLRAMSFALIIDRNLSTQERHSNETSSSPMSHKRNLATMRKLATVGLKQMIYRLSPIISRDILKRDNQPQIIKANERLYKLHGRVPHISASTSIKLSFMPKIWYVKHHNIKRKPSH